MLKATFPGQFRTHYIREASQHAFAKYGKIVEQSTFYAELNCIKDFTMAKKPLKMIVLFQQLFIYVYPYQKPTAQRFQQ